MLGANVEAAGRRRHRSRETRVSDDRLIQLLQYLAILLFVSAGALPLARSRYPLAKWAKWGSVAIFSGAFVYAVVLVVRWGMGASQ
jgi:hypothetical protein